MKEIIQEPMKTNIHKQTENVLDKLNYCDQTTISSSSVKAAFQCVLSVKFKGQTQQTFVK